MKKYIVSIYRHKPDKPESIVGIAEEVGVKGKMAFTNLDELWEILNPVKDELKQSKRREVPFTRKYGIEKRNEVRIKKEIPFVFMYKKRNLDASTMNYSRNGLGIKIHEKVNLPVGDIMNLQLKDSSAKAEVIWVDKKSDPPVTMAGFKIVEGRLNLN